MKIKDDFVLKKLAGSYVVVPVRTRAVDFSGIIKLTETGAFLWKLLEKGADREELIEKLKGFAQDHPLAWIGKLQAAVSATGDIPILGTSVTEYGVALGIDGFNGLVGSNVSGTSDLAPLDQQAQMIMDLFPETKTVGIIFCSNEANSKYQVEVVTKELEAKGVTVKTASFTDSNDIAMVCEDLCSQIDVLYIPTDNQAASCAETIANVVLEKKIPVIAGEEGICTLCGIATLTISYYDLGVTTGQMAVKILNGEEAIENMPIQYFTNPIKKFNVENGKLFGLEMPAGFEAIE